MYGSFAPTASNSGRWGLMARHFASAYRPKWVSRFTSTLLTSLEHECGVRRSNCLKRKNMVIKQSDYLNLFTAEVFEVTCWAKTEKKGTRNPLQKPCFHQQYSQILLSVLLRECSVPQFSIEIICKETGDFNFPISSFGLNRSAFHWLIITHGPWRTFWNDDITKHACCVIFL